MAAAPSPYVESEVHTDYLVAPDAEPLLCSTIRFPRGEQTIATIIRTKLAQEIHAFNERRTVAYGAEYLSSDEYQAVCHEGNTMLAEPLKKGKANPSTEQKIALRAFSERKFKLVIDGVDYTVPERRVTIDDETTIRFIRLIPYK